MIHWKVKWWSRGFTKQSEVRLKEITGVIHHPAATIFSAASSDFLFQLSTTRLKMAKGLRSSRNKANNRKLKANVFGPVENARKERMSAKLLEIALQPRPATDGDSKMEVEATGLDRLGQIIYEGRSGS